MKQRALLHDLAGRRFGMLVAVEFIPHSKARWRCVCDCGRKATPLGSNLIAGRSASCGCQYERSKARGRRTHGMTHTPEYKAWGCMRARCYIPSSDNFKYYGGRGITVCDRWRASFANFLADMGAKPSPAHSIDRTDNNGNYEPSNCRWATRVEQANNKRPCSRKATA